MADYRFTIVAMLESTRRAAVGVTFYDDALRMYRRNLVVPWYSRVESTVDLTQNGCECYDHTRTRRRSSDRLIILLRRSPSSHLLV